MEDLIEILRFAPKNIKLYCTIWGWQQFNEILIKTMNNY